MIPPNRTLTVEGKPAACIVAGPDDAPPLLLLHGGGIDRGGMSWERTIPALADRFHVICPDLPGYGDTAIFDGPYDVPRLGRWVVGFMEAIGLERAHVAGISMGGGAALWLALEAPERVGRLVPVCAYGLADRAPVHPLAWLVSQLPPGRLPYALVARSRRVARWTLAAIYGDAGRVDADTVADLRTLAADQARRRSFRAFQRAEIGPRRLKTVFMERLGRIAAPTLFIHGTADPLVPAAAARRAAARVPGAELALLEAGHWPMREVPGPFADALLPFLAAD